MRPASESLLALLNQQTMSFPSLTVQSALNARPKAADQPRKYNEYPPIDCGTADFEPLQLIYRKSEPKTETR